MEPQEYDVILIDNEPIAGLEGDMELERIRCTGWQVEGDFLCHWNGNGEKQAKRIPSNCTNIKTVRIEETVELPTVRGVAPDYADSAE